MVQYHSYVQYKYIFEGDNHSPKQDELFSKNILSLRDHNSVMSWVKWIYVICALCCKHTWSVTKSDKQNHTREWFTIGVGSYRSILLWSKLKLIYLVKQCTIAHIWLGFGVLVHTTETEF